MNKEKIDDLVDILGDEFAKIENTFVIRNQEQLVKYLENPREWKQKQLLSRVSYRRELISIAKSQIASINAKIEKVFLLGYQTVDNDSIKITETEIEVNDIPEELKKQIKNMQDFSMNGVIKLANQSLLTYTKTVRVIQSTSSQDELFDAIKNQMPKGIENGIKVAYKNGAEVSWKSYMEMNVRTTLHQEMTDMQIKAGAKVNQIFYMCDSFADCAPDHADYQGKVYYNEDCDIPPEVQAYIDSNNIQSMQSVIYGEPYLTSRPNCRHNFHAIPTDEVMTMPSEEILEKENLSHGEYKNSNYEAVQKQRYNERQIRKWKLRAENAEQLKKETNQDIGDIRLARMKVRQWQARQRELIQDNKEVLHRQYDRENAKVMVNDLGVKYKYKVVDGELVKK